ncbi:hypothetical protein WSS15_27370 [Acetobacter pasteurianus]|uniref:hypothetical protein n=1 Tax=Acetobacter pasteurianus TaxID=438 RepID=UPI0022BF20C9|nr:hypothetical protein [Acetobacter pasteurianus]GLH30087.1 hypothetical protein WSS15_27370 [Acetobacter pasteurianus]
MKFLILCASSFICASLINTKANAVDFSFLWRKINDYQVINTESGKYKVEIDKDVNLKNLPMNTDLKMLDGDITKYATQLCNVNFKNNLRPKICEVFVQPDPSGLLVGYATLSQRQDATLETTIETNPAKGGLGCWIGGKLTNDDIPENSKDKFDIAKDFSTSIAYSAWEKSPGNWMVSSNIDDNSGAVGVWYVKKSGNKLRINQERWNYCYSSDKIYIDEIFYHLATMTLDDN